MTATARKHLFFPYEVAGAVIAGVDTDGSPALSPSSFYPRPYFHSLTIDSY